MILTESHLHTSLGSYCGMVDPYEIPLLYKNAGYEAIIVTDHYFAYGIHVNSIDEWLEGYRIVHEEGKAIGLKVFLGMELTLNDLYADFLVYGFDVAFLRKNRKINELALKEVFELLDSYGFIIYQAHPFREKMTVCDAKSVHGLEVHNGNPRHESNNKKALDYAQRHSLLKISGSDFHRYEDLGRGGIYIDSEIETEKELAQFLRSRNGNEEGFLYRGSKHTGKS